METDGMVSLRHPTIALLNTGAAVVYATSQLQASDCVGAVRLHNVWPPVLAPRWRAVTVGT